MQPPLFHRGGRPAPLVVLYAAGDTRYRLAEANLASAGFQVAQGAAPETVPVHTDVFYTGATLKGTFHWLLAWQLGVAPEAIGFPAPEDVAPDPHFRVTLGATYDPCRPQLEAPLAAP